MDQGLLDLSVELSTQNVTAGNEFALYVLVRNPFQKPVWVEEVNVSLPSEIQQIQPDEEKHSDKISAEQQRLEEQTANYQDQVSKELSELHNKFAFLESEVSKIDSQDQNFQISKELWDIKRIFENIRANLNTSATSTSNIDIENVDYIKNIRIKSDQVNMMIRGKDSEGTEITSLEISGSKIEEEALKRSRTIRLKSSLPFEEAIQPGCTAVYTAVLNVDKYWTFTPSQFRLQFYVNYAFTRLKSNLNEAFQREEESDQNQLFSNTISYNLSIRPSLISILGGAILGGFLGTIARFFQIHPANIYESVAAGVLSIILSAIAVIFMARKSDTQPFLSIEDFWGGVLIGFLVGYTGTVFFEQLTGITPI